MKALCFIAMVLPLLAQQTTARAATHCNAATAGNRSRSECRGGQRGGLTGPLD